MVVMNDQMKNETMGGWEGGAGVGRGRGKEVPFPLLSPPFLLKRWREEGIQAVKIMVKCGQNNGQMWSK